MRVATAVVSLLPHNGEELEELVGRAVRARPDGIELRVDHVDLGRRELAALRRRIRSCRLIVASRRSGRERVLVRALQCGIDAIDVDAGSTLIGVDGRLGLEVGPGQTVIASFHDDRATPGTAALDALCAQLERIGLPKIAVTPRSEDDILRLCASATRWSRAGRLFILTAMGPMAKPARVLLPLLGSVVTYVALDPTATTATGQLTLASQRAFASSQNCRLQRRAPCLR